MTGTVRASQPCGADRQLRGTCDAPDMCDGKSAECPDVLQSAGHVSCPWYPLLNALAAADACPVLQLE